MFVLNIIVASASTYKANGVTIRRVNFYPLENGI